MAVSMKHLFEPTHTVDNWREVIADCDKSIELLEQGYNPMRVKASVWIIKYENMRSIALGKLYELEQGLRVAANTLKDEDNNEKLNGVRIPAGNAPGGIVHVNGQVQVAGEELDEGVVKGVEESQAEAPHNEKIEAAAKEEPGEGAHIKAEVDAVKEIDKKVAEVAKLKLVEGAVKGIEEGSRALASQEESHAIEDEDEYGRQEFRAADSNEESHEDEDEYGRQESRAVDDNEESRATDEKSRALVPYLMEIGNGAVKMADRECRASASHNERIEVACKEKLDKKALVETAGCVKMLVSKEAGEDEDSDELNGGLTEVIPRAAEIEPVDEKSWDLVLHLKTIGNEAIRNEYAEFVSEEGVKRTAEVTANRVKEASGKSRVDEKTTKEETKAEEHLKSTFKFGKVRSPCISKVSSEPASRSLDSVEEERVAEDMVNKYMVGEKEVIELLREGVRMMGEGAVVHTPNSIEFYDPKEKLFSNVPQSKNCIRLIIPFDHVNNKLKLEQKLLDYTILSKGFVILKPGTAYAKSEFIKKGVGGSYLPEQHANTVKNRVKDIGHGIAHDFGEISLVSRHQARDFAKLKLPGTTYVERFIAGFGLSRLRVIIS